MSESKKRALISVSNKNNLLELASALTVDNWEILSTGGTAKYLRDNGINITEVASVTGFPEILGGRVKTLHPKIHGGILAIRDDPDHAAQLAQHQIEPIDLLVVNLYPFVETINKPNVSLAEAIENIDVGGPAMIRAAAKNNKYITVVVSPDDYPKIINSVAKKELPNEEQRLKLAAIAFRHTSDYDNAINNYLQKNLAGEDSKNVESALPAKISLELVKNSEMRYGENSHQSAALYCVDNVLSGLSSAKVIQGKAMSFNNYADANAAISSILEFSEPACVIIKHANPCGVAISDSASAAYKLAFACDPVSAFGGILAFNRKVDANTANAIGEQFAEVIIAPEYSSEALEIFAKKTNLRLLQIPNLTEMKSAEGFNYRSIMGGFLVQSTDDVITKNELRVVSKIQPTDKDLAELIFAFTVAKHVKSNAIIFTNNRQTLGIGAGQMSRVDSTRIAAFKAIDRGFDIKGSFAASDAFFPFRDGIDEIAKAGVKAIIQPGGSMRDSEVISAADEQELIMVFTGIRHFRH